MENDTWFMALGLIGSVLAAILYTLFPKHYVKWLAILQSYFERKRVQQATKVAVLPGVTYRQYLSCHVAACKKCGRLTRNRFEITTVKNDGWTSSYSSPYCPECCD